MYSLFIYYCIFSLSGKNYDYMNTVYCSYYINLDPAVRGDTPFAANIDIRDTVDYKEVMKQYGLGPNGAILTSLNLFATKFDQVVRIFYTLLLLITTN